MPRPDPALLDPGRYPFHCSIETRFGDIDVNQHINNVALVGLLEEGRVRFHRASGYHAAIAGMTSMVASIAVEFLGQGYFPDPIAMHVALSQLGNTSYTLHQLVTQQGRTVACARAVMVCMDGTGPVPLPPAFRAGAEAWMLAA
ncbi:MAG: acyl-CoA thioesterase [Novosphingobium sp.]|jgi:acyl-CoA thioester hydrolase|nr:acyl-CoA thioesterase [Novosphingobium sp.]